MSSDSTGGGAVGGGSVEGPASVVARVPVAGASACSLVICGYHTEGTGVGSQLGGILLDPRVRGCDYWKVDSLYAREGHLVRVNPNPLVSAFLQDLPNSRMEVRREFQREFQVMPRFGKDPAQPPQ